MSALITLRLAVKAINDSLGPEGLVPSLLVFGSMPSLPAFKKPYPERRERMAALSFLWAEMKTVFAEPHISQAARSKLKPAIHAMFNPDKEVQVYKKQECTLFSLVQVIQTTWKGVTVADINMGKTFGISQVNPSKSSTYNRDLQRLHSGIQKYIQGCTPREILTEAIELHDPKALSGRFQTAIHNELIILWKQECFMS